MTAFRRLPLQLGVICVPGLLAGLPVPSAHAQSGGTFACPGELPGSRPLPRIVAYGVSASTDPDSVRSRFPHEASVIGGHAERGIVRVDVQLDAALPAGCPLPLQVDSASATGANPAAESRELVNAVDGIELRGAQVRIDQVAANRMRAVANGTDLVRLEVPIQGTDGPRPVRHALKLVYDRNFAAGLPFSVVAQPLDRFVAAVPAQRIVHGEIARLHVTHPTPLLPETASWPVRITLSDPGLGSWQAGEAVNAANPRELVGSWDRRFTPLRAEAPLQPANVTAPVSGTVTFSWAGQSEVVPVTINPSDGCNPVFTASAEPGGVRVSMTNRLRGSCPAHVVTPRLPERVTLQLAPASATISIGAVADVQGAAPPLRVLSGAPQRTSGRLAVQQVPSSTVFTINPLALIQLAVGTRYVFEVRSQKGGALQTVAFTVTGRDHAIITGR